MVVRAVLVLLAAGFVSASALGARVPDAIRSRTVPCDEIVGLTRFPHWGNAQPQYRNRLVLNAVSVPPAFLPQTGSSGEPQWPYFSKWGMVVRSDARSVTVTVPARWRDRVAISWGNAGHGVFQTIRFRGCGSGENVGNAYAGGFFLHSRSACVPLTFRVSSRTATVRFGIGQRCR
jgi:hypothetical protein